MKLHKPITYWKILKRRLHTKHAEPKVWDIMNKIRGKLFVDVGANIGMYSIMLAKHFKQVVAFEPNNEYAYKFEYYSRHTKNITLVRQALSNYDGKTKYYVNNRSDKSSGSADTIFVENTTLPQFHYKPASSPNLDIVFEYQNNVEVDCCRLDTFFDQEIDLLKIDVEGAEFLVLEGAKRLLSNHMILYVIVELHNRDRAVELVQLFHSHNYNNTRWIDSDHLYASCIPKYPVEPYTRI